MEGVGDGTGHPGAAVTRRGTNWSETFDADLLFQNSPS